MIKHKQEYLQILKEELVPAMGCTNRLQLLMRVLKQRSFSSYACFNDCEM